MMIFLLGVEQETNRRLAIDGGARHLGMTFPSLLKRLPKKKPYLIAERFPDTAEVMLAGGSSAVLKMSDDELGQYVFSFIEFVERNAAALSMVTAIDDPRLEGSAIDMNMGSLLGDRWVPVWRAETGVANLEALAEAHKTVALRADIVRDSPALMARLNPLRARYGTDWHVLDGARPDDLVTGRFQSAATMAWLSPMRNGETIVFDGNRMQRYPKRMRDVARPRHRSAFTRAGFDADAILEGDHNELTRYTASAFVAWENHLSKGPKKPDSNPFRVVTDDNVEEIKDWATSETRNESGAEVERPPTDPHQSPLVTRNEQRGPVRREEGQGTLPAFDFEVQKTTELLPDGTQQEVERLLARKSNVTLRQCDSCHVAATCPAFQPGHECAYNFPVEVRTKEQLLSLMAAIVEKQADRVAFMTFQEDLNGGYADPNTSAEIDRLLALIERMKNIEDNKEYLRLQVEARSSVGAISRLFGEQAKQLSDLDRPLPSRAIEGIVEGEIIE